jgi:dipeptidyl aminopeptidase/acylaminoacyl peptidase
MNKFLAVLSVTVAAAVAAPDEPWENLPDGSTGQVTEFHGVDGLAIPAYVRKPKGDGPFPIVILAHGGVYGKPQTLGMGRSQKSPTEDFIQAGWAIYSIDYRPAEKIAVHPIEFDDTVEAVKAVRKLSFVDPQRVGYIGGSHGAQVGAKVVSRIDLSGAILCAPAAMDLIEDKKAISHGEKLVGVLSRMIADLEKQYGATLEEVDKDRKKYGYSSPIDEAAQVRCPLLIVNGKADDNSPVSIIDIYVNRLRAAGKKVETYLPDNMPHGFYFGRPEGPEYHECARLSVAFLRKCFQMAP